MFILFVFIMFVFFKKTDLWELNRSASMNAAIKVVMDFVISRDPSVRNESGKQGVLISIPQIISLQMVHSSINNIQDRQSNNCWKCHETGETHWHMWWKSEKNLKSTEKYNAENIGI